MGGKALKTEHSGAKNGGGMWGTREEAKTLSKTERRVQAKREVAAAASEAPAPCFWCGKSRLLNDQGECQECAT